MLQSFAMRTLLPIILRATLAVVFIYHGLEKVTPDSGYGIRWMPAPADGSAGLPMGLQLAVAWGELLGGVAIALGLLTRIAALGIIGIMAGAIVTVTGHTFSLLNKGFEYNFVLIMVALALIITGAGTLSLDQVIRVKMRGPAKY
jgi:putative oxidoreductase